MTTYYVGPGGNDASDGLSWANRKLTLNGAEDVPIAAGDTVYVGPGTYRETLTTDVNGTSGNVITYIADVTGANTDNVGGIVRITGSDNDQTATRAICIDCGHNYRTFKGFLLTGSTSRGMRFNNCTNGILEDSFVSSISSAGVEILGASQANNTIRRCFIHQTRYHAISVTHSSVLNDKGHVIQNCVLMTSPNGHCVAISRVGGITVKNCTILAGSRGVRVVDALDAGQTTTVQNCIISGVSTALEATATGELTEDYNCLYNNLTDRTNVSTGSNSVAYIPGLEAKIFYSGVEIPWNYGALASWSPLARFVGTGELTGDIYGITRPTTSGKKSLGAIQFSNTLRDTDTTYNQSVASLKLSDAGVKQIILPVKVASKTLSVYCYRESGYTGTAPRMVIKEPGQSDRTTTDSGASGAWNLLTDTFTPTGNTDYVVVELQSLNSASSGSYAAYFDNFQVT